MRPDLRHADRRPVLVVEDSDDDFDTVVAAAHQAGVSNRLVRAVDGDAARHLLARHPREAFAFMLLDYSLPGLDGLALLDRVRRDCLLTCLPVVVFTTSINPHDRDLFCAAGASAFHVKDVQHAVGLRTLEAIFDHWLNRPAPPATLAVEAHARRST